MGWTVLYLAFGCVALWLLGEVLLQYKARLRWRLLAFTGFLGVVLGVLMASIPVIFVGTAAFAMGQLFVTLSFRRGFSTGWALGGKPGSSRRRRSEEGPPAPARDSEPALEVSQLEETSAYQPFPMPDDTGQYGVYERESDDPTGATSEEYAASASPQSAQSDPYASQADGYQHYAQPGAVPRNAFASHGYDTAAFDASSYGTGTYGTGHGMGDTGDLTGVGDTGSYDTAAYSSGPYGVSSYDTHGSGVTGMTGYESTGAQNYQDPYSTPFYSAPNDQSYGNGYGEDYGTYAEPYAMGGTSSQPPITGPNDLYDPLSGDYQGGFSHPASPGVDTGYGGYGYDAEQYQVAGYQPQTPPGGVWVPPQREPDPAQQPPYPPRNSGDHGYYDSQQRY